ncbi:hypothetical protein OF83DRAFT_1019993, partial [Amylostereum chailletii]
LPDEEKARHSREIHRRICCHFGEEAYAALSDDANVNADLFIWMGCCMHKDLNATKGGDWRMTRWWATQGLTGPICLMNKDNSTAASLGPSAAAQRAEDVSQGGAVKAVSLMGVVLKNRDHKKGQQDLVGIFTEHKLGYPIRFPQTNNTCFQSHSRASEVVFLHTDLWIEFFDSIRDKKDSQTLNHIELNVYKALHDIPTLTEMAVHTIYSQTVSIPFSHATHQQGANMLDLGPVHEHVKAHCRAVISNPNIILAS